MCFLHSSVNSFLVNKIFCSALSSQISSMFPYVQQSNNQNYIFVYVAIPVNRPWRPIGLWDIKNPTLSRQSAQKAVRLSALRTGHDLLPRTINFFLLVLIFVTGWVNPRALYGMKDYVNWIFIHFAGSQTRDLPVGTKEPYTLRYRALQRERERGRERERLCVCVSVCVCVNGYKKTQIWSGKD
jgi:hypothetical protein